MRHWSSAFVVVVVLMISTVDASSASASSAHVPLSGSGSSWAANAIFRWSSVQRQHGITVNYSAGGSGRGLDDFANGQTDFAVTDLTYADVGEQNPARAFAYFPITAGAIVFPYQVKVGGTLKRDVRLSGRTLARIFAGTIRNWNDPAITADNNGRQVAPDLQITKVIRSDGSATSYHLTEWFSLRFAKQWPFARDGATSFFPTGGGKTFAATGSISVVNQVMAGDANGTIGYVEKSFVPIAGTPVASVENLSGHFLPPDANNVSLALLQAKVTAGGEADLRPVYRNPDTRAYPLSYYSYGIVPIGTDVRTTTAVRQTDVDFFGYTSCGGQDVISRLGYAPLPLNLTRAALEGLARLKSVDPAVDIRALAVSSCGNPTISHADDGSVSDALAPSVPQPRACTAAGAGPCKP